MCILIKNKLFLLVFVVKVEIFFEIVDFEYGFDVDLCVLGLKDDVVGIFFEVEVLVNNVELAVFLEEIDVFSFEVVV
jgi:hypothetical protein